MTILIVGGAGYIGSHMVHYLNDLEHDLIVLDNLSTGLFELLPERVKFVFGDLADKNLLKSIFAKENITTVMHFAAHIEVSESVAHPFKYYHNNVSATLTLLQVMLEHKVNQFVFSSTAAIFGDPVHIPINEDHHKVPINPYGRSKLMIEEILSDFDLAYGMKSICLRYFNAAGADEKGRTGECHNPETHLIPLVLQAASGRRSSISIFGTDYETFDGTCVRDYIHVSDLCEAHYLALKYLQKENISARFNLGIGNGFSVRQVIESVKRVSGKNFKIIETTRREGDPSVLIADSSLAKSMLLWNPKFTDLDCIVSHAWNWEINCHCNQ